MYPAASLGGNCSNKPMHNPKGNMKTTSYQVERKPKGKEGWEQLAPVIEQHASDDLSNAILQLKAHRVVSYWQNTGDCFRLVKNVRSIFRA